MRSKLLEFYLYWSMILSNILEVCHEILQEFHRNTGNNLNLWWMVSGELSLPSPILLQDALQLYNGATELF